MKYILYIFIILFAKVSLGQEDTTKNEVFTIVEEMPEFTEGNAEMYKFIATNVVYPIEAKQNNWTGKVYVNFIVTPQGDLTKVRTLKSSGYSILDDEAIRVVKSMPKWKPGMQNGKAVFVMYNLPFNFTLSKHN